MLEKYLKNFRMELKNEGKVSIFVDWKKVLDIYSRIHEAWVREKHTHSSIWQIVSDMAEYLHNDIILTKNDLHQIYILKF